MKTLQVILTLICLAGLAALPALLTENFEEKEVLFYRCQDRVSIPVVGISSFAWCPEDNTVWTGEEWLEPSNFEQRRIDIYLEHLNKTH